VNKSYKYGVGLESVSNPVASDNIFKDMWINNTDSSDVYLRTVGDGTKVLNNVFLNVSFNSSNVSFSLTLGEAELVRQWYVNVNITNSTSQMDGATINLYNNTGSDVKYTGSSVLTGYKEFNVTDYIQTDDNTFTRYNNYTVNISKTGFVPNSTEVNVSGNTVITLNIDLDTTPPDLDLIAPANNTLNTTTNTINFYYNVSDNADVDNCSLIINDKLNKTDTSVTNDKSVVQNITIYLAECNCFSCLPSVV